MHKSDILNYRKVIYTTTYKHSSKYVYTGYPEITNATDNKTQFKSTGGNMFLIPVWEQLATDQFATDQTDPWQVVPRQVFTRYDCLLISVAFVVLCHVGCLW